MRKIATVALLLVALLLVFAEPSLAWRGQHHGGTRVFIGFGGYYPYYPYYPYWYYCPSSRGYYPSVQTCPETWVKVPPRQD